MIQNISHNNKLLAIIIRNNYRKEGIEFFTPGDFSQQLGYMNRKKGYIIQPHVHNSVERKVHYTKEVLFVKSGKARIDFYDDNKDYINKSTILEKGDVILLAYGGHGFEALEDLEMIEVKQGPYVGDLDKTHFRGINASEALIIKDE